LKESHLVKRLFLLATSAIIASGAAAQAAPQNGLEPGARAQAVIPAERNEQLARLFEGYDQANLAYSPVSKAYRGIRDAHYGSWDNFSDAADVAEQQRLQATARAMRALFDPATLSPEDSLSYRLFDSMAKRSAASFPYRKLDYIFDQMNGSQSQLPAFLINIHSVENLSQAEAYVSRIAGIGSALGPADRESRERAANGVMPPKWVYPYVISDIDNLLNAGAANAVLDDFRREGREARYSRSAEGGPRTARCSKRGRRAPLRPTGGCGRKWSRQQAIAGTDDGVWRLPDGEAYYNVLLANYTTTDLTADQIHDLGLKENRANPRRDARDHGAGRLHRHAAGLLRVHPYRPALLRQEPRGLSRPSRCR
jgi:uncharacterized protein (DUF885 family)